MTGSVEMKQEQSEASEGHGPRTKAPPPWLPLLSIIVLHAAVQAWIIGRGVCPARDGARYITYALRLEVEPWLHVIRTSVDHPGYPVAVRAVYAAASALGADSPAARVLLAQVTSSAAGLLFLLCAHRVTRRLWGEGPAWAGAMALAALPRPAETFGDALSDSLHALFWMASAALILKGFLTGRARWLLLAGLAASLAYWVRVDALTLPASVIAASFIIILAGPGRLDLGVLTRGRTATGCALFLIAFGAGLALFVAACGRISPKPIAGEILLGLGRRVARGAEIAAAPLPGNLGPFLGALWHLAKDFAQEVQFVHVASAGLATILVTRRRRPGPAAIFILTAAAAYGAVLVLVEMEEGYLTGRYLLPLIPFLIAYGMWGLAEAARSFVPLRGIARRAPPLLLAASIACSVPSLLRGRLHDNAHGALEAGRWIAGTIAEGETLHDPYFYPSYLAGLRGRHTPRAEPSPGSRGHYVIVDEGLRRKVKGLSDLIDAKRATKIAAFAHRPGDGEKRVGVHRVEPSR